MSINGNKKYTICMIGAQNTGKKSLQRAFLDVTDDMGNRGCVTLNKNTLASIDITYADHFLNIDFKKISGLLVVYSVTDKHSFREAARVLKLISPEAIRRRVPIILVTNKIDVAELYKNVSYEDSMSLATFYSIDHVETSAIDHTNIKYVFSKMARTIYITGGNRDRNDSMVSIDLSDDAGAYHASFPSCCKVCCICLSSLFNRTKRVQHSCENSSSEISESDYQLL